MLKKLNTFFLNTAEYKLGDINGNLVLMRVDYTNKKFSLEIVEKGEGLEVVMNEGELIAKHLLKDKAKVNLAERIKAKVI